jgi:hypothetical protein
MLAASPPTHEPHAVAGKEAFEDATNREIDRAKRHGRRLAIAAMLARDAEVRPSGGSGVPSSFEELVLGVVRESDVLGRGDDGEHLLLLPETGALGAHACRRRLLRLASSRDVERRPWVSVGVATFPHDGRTREALVERARLRLREASRSIVHTHALHGRPLRDVVHALLDGPPTEPGTPTPALSRTRVSPAVAQALVSAACREALRGGAATLLVALGADSGTRAAALAFVHSSLASLHEVDPSTLAVDGDVEAMVVVAEHGTWTYCARHAGPSMLVACSADPILADVVSHLLAKDVTLTVPATPSVSQPPASIP